MINITGVYNVENKRKRGSSIIFPIILRLLGRISIGKGDGNFAEGNQDYKKCVGKNIKLHGTLYTPEIRIALLFTQITFVEKPDGRKG